MVLIWLAVLLDGISHLGKGACLGWGGFVGFIGALLACLHMGGWIVFLDSPSMLFTIHFIYDSYFLFCDSQGSISMFCVHGA